MHRLREPQTSSHSGSSPNLKIYPGNFPICHIWYGGIWRKYPERPVNIKTRNSTTGLILILSESVPGNSNSNQKWSSERSLTKGLLFSRQKKITKWKNNYWWENFTYWIIISVTSYRSHKRKTPTFLPSTAVTCSQKWEYEYMWEDSKTGRPQKGSDIQWKKDDDNDNTN